MDYITEIEEKLKSITDLSYDDVQCVFNGMVPCFSNLFSVGLPLIKASGKDFFKFDCEDYLVFLIENGFRFYKDCIFSSQIFKELRYLFLDIKAKNFAKDLYMFLVEAILIKDCEIKEIEKHIETVNGNEKIFFKKIILFLKKLEKVKLKLANEKI